MTGVYSKSKRSLELAGADDELWQRLKRPTTNFRLVGHPGPDLK
jgi:hypothetical protein